MKNKLSQKSSGTQSEETVLMKSFKYFDLNNNGTVEPEEFAKAIEKIGIMIPTRQVRILINLFTVCEGPEAFDFVKPLRYAEVLNIIYRIWTPSSTYTTQTEVALLTIKSSDLPFSAKRSQEVHPPREAQVHQTKAQRSLQESSLTSSHPEVQEESLASASSSESWTITTQEPSICTSLPKP